MVTPWPTAPERLSAALLAHYDQTGRKLPWRQTRDPYAIWLAEVMLQQTGVATVIPYYHRFLARFPTLQHLARADLEQVLACWQGLGYYQRARNLHQAAVQVVATPDGQLPRDAAGWRTLPGVGANTAAAVMAIAHDAPLAILDGNVKRVVQRLLAPDTPPATAQLWRLAQALTPTRRPGDYAQAIMDLGATVCLPKGPRCGLCPWSSWCRARALGRQEDFPPATVKPERPRLQQAAVLLQRGDGALLLLRRPAGGLLGGLWEPPASLASATPPPGAAWILEEFGVTGQGAGSLPLVRHAFTHFHLTVTPHLYHHLTGEPCLTRHTAWCWADDAVRKTLPMATLHRKILAGLQSCGKSARVFPSAPVAQSDRAPDS